MTDRMTPVGSWRGAEAVLVAMFVEVTQDDVIGDVAGRGGEVTALPEALAPIALADVLELLLDFARRSPPGTAAEVADRDMRRDFHEHVDMIARQYAMNDRHAHFGTNLSNDLQDPQAHLAMQHFEPIFRRPDPMVAMMKCRVATAMGRVCG
jgi:hypothetical protein